MTRLPAAPSPPFLGPAARRSTGSNKPIERIVIHSTVSPCVPGGARNIAAFFRGARAAGSAHYVVDPVETVQCVWDSVIAWHAPPNQHSLGIEMCDMPGPVPKDKQGSARWKALRRSWRWSQPRQIQMLRRTAKLTAQLCAAYDVPAVYLSAAALRRNPHRKGITTHANVSAAFKQSTHWDPGWWPRVQFMGMVRRELAAINKKGKP